MRKVLKNLKKKTENKPIGVFDSGVGGLSVLVELRSLLPRENFIFFADQRFLPYGNKSEKLLEKRVLKISAHLIKENQIKMLVIACNTATSNTIKKLREKYRIPIVGTLPAVKTASEKTKTNIFGVISTKLTAKSKSLQDLINQHCRDKKVINIGSKSLVSLVEGGNVGSQKAIDVLTKELGPIAKSKADYLVLGCTHYPFLKKSIKKILGSRVKLLDSGKAIAKRTKFLLVKDMMENKQKKPGGTVYFTTLDAAKFSGVASKLMKTKVEAKSVEI